MKAKTEKVTTRWVVESAGDSVRIVRKEARRRILEGLPYVEYRAYHNGQLRRIHTQQGRGKLRMTGHRTLDDAVRAFRAEQRHEIADCIWRLKRARHDTKLKIPAQA